MRRSARVRGSAATVVGLLAVAGCGSGGGTAAGQPPSSSGPAVVAATYTTTSAQKTARLSLAYHLAEGSAASGGSADVRLSGEGLVDFAHKTSSITMHTSNGQDLQERLLGNMVYVKVPDRLAQADPQLHGKSWLRSDLTRAKNATLGFGVGGSDGSDPTQVLRLLSDVADGVDSVGADTVRGAPATHYRVQLDLDKIAAKSGASAAQVKSIETLIGGKTFPVDVWVDGQGRAVRLQFKFPPKPVTSPAPGEPQIMVEGTEEWYDFGTPVTVEAPPAKQVLDASSLMRNGSGKAPVAAGQAGSGTGA